MLVLSVQRISRPLINLLVARSSSSETEATKVGVSIKSLVYNNVILQDTHTCIVATVVCIIT